MSEAEIVAAPDNMDTSDYDNERIHAAADHLLFQSAPAAVQDAYKRLSERVSFWYA